MKRVFIMFFLIAFWITPKVVLGAYIVYDVPGTGMQALNNYTGSSFSIDGTWNNSIYIDGEIVHFMDTGHADFDFSTYKAHLSAENAGSANLYISEIWKINESFDVEIPVTLVMDVHASVIPGLGVQSVWAQLNAGNIQNKSNVTDQSAYHISQSLNSVRYNVTNVNTGVMTDWDTEGMILSTDPDDYRVRLMSTFMLMPEHNIGVRVGFQAGSFYYGGSVDMMNTAALSIILPEGYTASGSQGYDVPEAQEIVPTPEPSSFLLLGVGLLGLAVAGRKARQLWTDDSRL